MNDAPDGGSRVASRLPSRLPSRFPLRPARRWLYVAIGLLLAVAAGTFLAYRFALNELRAQVLAALGPNSQIGDVDVSLRAIHITALKLKAPQDWPTPYALSAAQVVIVPDLASLFTGTIVISRIKVENTTLAVLRDRSGRMRVLPGLTERKAGPVGKPGGGSGPATKVFIGEVVLEDSAVAFFDAEVRSPPLNVTLLGVDARVTRLRMPELAEKSAITLTARIKGPAHDGSLAINGWMVVATRDSELTTKVRGVDIVSLEPYLIRKAETGVRKGVLDLDLTSRVAARRVTAPGKLKLKDLELRADGGIGTFMGMPRDSLVGLLRERDGSITVPFTIEGDLNDPAFTLDSAFKARVGIAAAATLGIAIKDLIDVFGNRQDKTGDGGNTNKVLNAIKGLLGK